MQIPRPVASDMYPFLVICSAVTRDDCEAPIRPVTYSVGIHWIPAYGSGLALIKRVQPSHIFLIQLEIVNLRVGVDSRRCG